MRIIGSFCSAIVLAFTVTALQAQQAGQQVEAQSQQTQQASQAQIDNFKKAFSACMEGKQYTAKF